MNDQPDVRVLGWTGTWPGMLTVPKSLAISLPSRVLAISGWHGDLGLSKAACGKVGSAGERLYKERKAMKLVMATGRVYEIR